MHLRHIRWLVLIVFAVSFLGFVGCGGGTDRYIIVSGGQGGVYYTAAGKIAQLAQQADANLSIDVQTSGGSVANARHLHNNEAHFAMIQSDIAAYARDGEKMFSKSGAMPEIRGVAALYPEHIQLVARADADIAQVSDLRGKRVAIGDIGSGTEANAMQILEAHGIDLDDLGETHRLEVGESADYMQDNRIDAAFFTFGIGAADIRRIVNDNDVVFVPIEGGSRDNLIEQYPFYSEAVIPAGAYLGSDDSRGPVPATGVSTVSVTATLVAREDVPDEVVSNVLHGIFDNLNEFRRQHPRLNGVNKTAARDNLSIPLHPGAEAFYDDAAGDETDDAQQAAKN